MSESTPLRLPPSLPYPITITRLLQSSEADLQRGTPLLEYSFVSDELRKAILSGKERGKVEDDMIGSWESPIEGTLTGWEGWVVRGRKVEKRDASKTALRIEQPCTHPVQLHGLCGVCGKELTESDYLSRGNAEAGPSATGGFEMGHDALGVTVSSDEARRLDTQTRDNLLSSRKLSLIVDLDQTIIHTTVDPTVWEWMQETASQQQQEQHPQEQSTTPPGSPTAGTSSRKRKRESHNPNGEALKDVAMFQLEDGPAPGEVLDPRRRSTMRTYFTKPRPGLTNFLSRMSELYEMHVYTMGSRNYADAIVHIVDPDDKIFGGRILSRDESGSFTSKSLTRLFPTDQSMVVVIDDRSDVWDDIPNLVKVVPYDFFVGIGDINSSFLPPTPKPPGGTTASPASASPNGDGSTPAEGESEDSEEDNIIRQKKLLDQMSEDRPLAKMQEKLKSDAGEGTSEASDPLDGGTSGEDGSVHESPVNGEEGSSEAADQRLSAKTTRPLLRNDDRELDRVAKILREVHRDFYRAYDQRDVRTGNDQLPLGCDVELILPDIKSRTFAGCNIVFSGVIPRHVPPESSEVWRAAETFGAIPSLKVTRETTHCVTATIGTEKTYYATKYGAKVVWVKWFNECVALWRKVEEGPYLAYPDQEGQAASSAGAPISNGGDTNGGLGGAPTEGDDVQGTGGTTPMEVDPTEEDNFDLGNWNADDDKEMEDFFGDMGEDSEMGTEDGEGRSRRDSPAASASPSPPPSTPGGTRKRVRYADEEHLPLSTFREPDAGAREYVHQMQNRHDRPPLMLMPPKEGEVPEENRMMWKGKMRDSAASPNSDNEQNGAGAEETKKSEETTQAAASDVTVEDSEDVDGEDEFAKMLLDELGD